MKRVLLALLLTLSTLGFSKRGVDVTVNLSPAGSFHVKSSKIRGKLLKKGNLYLGKKLSVRVNDLKTGIDLRDDHMKKRLDPKKHPSIIVTNVKAKGGKGVGKITIKGITKPFRFVYKLSGKIMESRFKLDLDQFKVKDLNYMGVGAKNIVNVSANIPVR